MFPLIRSSLYQGDVLLLHCFAGKHRAAVLGVILVAEFGRMSFPEALKEVLRRRPVRVAQSFEERAFAEWGNAKVHEAKLLAPWPKCTGWITTGRSHAHVQTLPGIPRCCHRQGVTKYDRGVTTVYPQRCAWLFAHVHIAERVNIALVAWEIQPSAD